jgi:membrane associated rhomboid family serine protease
MGIYDREYYRRSGPSFLGSISAPGQVCKWLIGINIVVFILQLMTRDYALEIGDREYTFLNVLWLDVDQVLHGQVWRLLTYAFVHDPSNLWHIVFNMLFLWWFGTDMEAHYGPREFLTFYLSAAVIGGLTFLLTGLTEWRHAPCLGASGAVTAVLVLCAFHFPHRVIYLFFLLPVPLWLLVVLQVAQDAFVFLGHVKSPVAVTVHLGGAAFAALYYKRHWRLLNVADYFRDWQMARRRSRLRVYREEPPQPVPVAAPPLSDSDEQLEAKLDAVLEKVARHGQGSLTEHERQILLRASEVYKRRRT